MRYAVEERCFSSRVSRVIYRALAPVIFVCNADNPSSLALIPERQLTIAEAAPPNAVFVGWEFAPSHPV
jgi:hypothetical protein